MEKGKNIALVAHDNRKQDLIEWVKFNKETLYSHKLICTGTTGKLVENALKEGISGISSKIKNLIKIDVVKLKSGPLGGDQQLGALIAEGKIDILIFLWDPMQPQPHDVDVRSLLRIATLYNIPTATNRSTADFIISSQLFNEEYSPIMKDYSSYLERSV